MFKNVRLLTYVKLIFSLSKWSSSYYVCIFGKNALFKVQLCLLIIQRFEWTAKNTELFTHTSLSAIGGGSVLVTFVRVSKILTVTRELGPATPSLTSPACNAVRARMSSYQPFRRWRYIFATAKETKYYTAFTYLFIWLLTFQQDYTNGENEKKWNQIMCCSYTAASSECVSARVLVSRHSMVSSANCRWWLTISGLMSITNKH